ncbi:hypothetical protein IB241_02890 [Pseudomonas sp. PDM05]|uniref:hypothetical protein n=1 Tax=Pseudomonas sp. PDM05 TaxID=2769301 RepID=UPI0017839774|nr:hypothetical protein [Pseudomonas sp. PDM05]MBD9456614.1 hypothetical protein [Pseudomonas sp. PDM05]
MDSRYSYSLTRAAQDLQNARLLVGKRLSVLMHDQYYFNGEKDLGDIGSIEWRFGEQETMSMYLLSDGVSVGADVFPLNTPDAFEIESGVICSWKRENLLTVLSAPYLAGQKICEVEGILDAFNGREARLVGFRIEFESGDFLVFLNQGDDAVMLINTPPPAIAEIETSFVTFIQQ